MIGIYKITNLINKKVYIGQSTNIKKRWSDYKRLNCKGQPLLYRSLKKYGVENHKFEIITECDFENLNKFERYYQDIYNVCGKNGLNCKLVGIALKVKRRLGNKEINLRNQEKINEWIIKNGFEKRIKIIEIQEIEKKQNKKYKFNYCTECNYKNKKEIHKVCVEATNEKEAWKKIKKKYKEYENFRNIDFC